MIVSNEAVKLAKLEEHVKILQGELRKATKDIQDLKNGMNSIMEGIR